MKQQGRPAAIQPARAGGEADFDEMPVGSIGNRALMRTQTNYATAIQVQKPRELKVLRAKVLEEAELAGESFFYSWTTNNKDGSRGLVEGISIEGAMILARHWGNDATDVAQADETPSHWLLDAVFIDHETGFTTNRLFRQRKAQAAGKMDAERAQDIAFQIGQSKAIRNVIDKAMPGWLKAEALEASKAAAEKGLGDLPKAIESVIAGFGKIGVTEPMLVWKVGLPRAKWIARDVLSLRAIGYAIRDRQTNVASEFGDFASATAEQPANANGAPAGGDASAQSAQPPQPKPVDFGDGSATPPTADGKPATEAKPAADAKPAAEPEQKAEKAAKKTREPGDEG